MKYASEDLRVEHEGVLFGLDILEKMADTIRRGGVVDFGDAKEMVNFFRLFADKCHHGKEEGLLFPAMEKAGIPNKGGPIGSMLLDHNQGRQYIAEMGATAEGSALQTDRFLEAATNYVQLMRAHIDRENSVLFPAGDRMLPAEVQKQLLDRFEGFEEEVMGKGTHDKLHETLHRLEGKYLQTA
jgi:hemerythrin-like domain-containing protein